MAENSGFFRSVNGDRKYSVSFLAKWAGCFVSNGVYNGDLAVTAGENMQVVVPAGRAWLGPNGERYKYENDSDKALPIANADGVLARKDTIVLRWDVNERSITAQVLTGEFSSNPVAPAISRTAEQYDLKLAEIHIAPGATAITQAVITDTRLDSAVCGIVTSIVTQVDTSTFYNQIQSDLAQFRAKNQAEFTTWFQSIRDVLDESAAGNLLNMIQTHEADTVAHVTQADHDKINGAATKSTLTAATLPASGWTGSAAPYSQTVSITGAKPEPTRIEVQPTTDSTAEQWTAWRAALVRGGGQGTDSITLLADGDKPAIDIPIAVTIRGDVS
ncbi:MAG: hypothetical protein ACQGTM_08210 [bacterium]